MKYVIQTCKDRLWYVEDILVPSLVNQEIATEDIIIWPDSDDSGCLNTCMNKFAAADYDAWYLQDDVIVCSDFKKRTQNPTVDIICGFVATVQNNVNLVGYVDKKDMWFSFPCIYVSKSVANGCAKWFFDYVVRNSEYRMWIRAKKYDDSIFYIYVQDYSSVDTVLNLAPNLVEHIDYLIGGSKVNSIRKFKAVSAHFNEPDLVAQLALRLKDYDNK